MDDNEIKKRLAGRAAEYMMFKDDEEDTEAPADTSSAGNVIVFPDFEKLKNEVEKMRTELSMLLLERDELQFVICKNIETEYMLKLGSIEYKAYEAQCAALRLKRKIELIQAKKNRQEKVIISAIEETLDSEFAEYQKQLNEQIDKMNAIIAYKAKFYGEVMLNAFYYFPMQFYGIYVWSKHMNTETHEVEKREMKRKGKILLGLCVAGATIVYGFVLKILGGSLPFIDALSTVVSDIAMIISIKMY